MPLLSSVRPHPIAHLRHILEVRTHIFCVPGEQVVALCYQRWGESSHACGSSHGLDTKMIATHMVQHDHVEGRGGRPLFYKPAHMETRRVGSSMNNFMNGSRIPMECKHHRRINRKVLDEGSIIHAMRMQEWRSAVLCIQPHSSSGPLFTLPQSGQRHAPPHTLPTALRRRCHDI